MEGVRTVKKKGLYKQFEDFILNQYHPCLMARAAFSNHHVDFHEYNLADKALIPMMLKDLSNYIDKVKAHPKHFFSYIAAFPGAQVKSEKYFEDFLWAMLQKLHEQDDASWDQAVSADPERNDFSMSLLGKAFYIVGMHPYSSRKARQTPAPALVFNLHSQFEKLRELGIYDGLKEKIRARDMAHQGSINPMLADFGKGSEAKQYSGRAVDESWKCPFHHK